MKRKSILAAATALAVVAAGVITGVAVTARSASAALSDVPKDCSISTSAYRSDGQRLLYRYAGGTTSTRQIAGDKLGWVPTALDTFLSSGSSASFMDSSLATHPTDGYVYYIKRSAEQVDGAWRITSLTVTRVRSGFAGTRAITMAWTAASPYFYRLAGNYLYRHTLTFVDGQPQISAGVQLPGSTWNTVNTLKYQRTVGTGSAAVDVLIGTKANGELKQWRINYASPATYSSLVLRASGWGSFTSINAWAACDEHPRGRVLLGIKATGAASVHFDADQYDGDGSDIKGGSLGLLGWTAKAY
ncbi:hypothetical protein [Kribbella sp. HUAS MG21]|uniref:Uncharacterized protein n=1 Tax=Kribbella sp. HUAS MG21 TaxID=3160966 RepID=A0AAU7T605_9ACTN